jgi:hypothetical protein
MLRMSGAAIKRAYSYSATLGSTDKPDALTTGVEVGGEFHPSVTDDQ